MYNNIVAPVRGNWRINVAMVCVSVGSASRPSDCPSVLRRVRPGVTVSVKLNYKNISHVRTVRRSAFRRLHA